jgi:hypothetical protein
VEEDVAAFRHGVPQSARAKVNTVFLPVANLDQNGDLKQATATTKNNSKDNDNRRSFDSRFAHRSG